MLVFSSYCTPTKRISILRTRLHRGPERRILDSKSTGYATYRSKARVLVLFLFYIVRVFFFFSVIIVIFIIIIMIRPDMTEKLLTGTLSLNTTKNIIIMKRYICGTLRGTVKTFVDSVNNLQTI